MALVLKHLYRLLVNFSEKYPQDPRTNGYPLVGSPVPALIVVILYVLIAKKWGPNWMKDRKPYNVKRLIQAHNLLQVVLNTYAFVIGLRYSYLRNDFSLTCKIVDYNDKSPATIRLLETSFIYYILKYLDLFDTVFFVLRKKNNHVSFLHVYHHSIMIIAVWIYLSYLFGSHATMLGVVNSFVHIVMYTYYLVSSLNLRIDVVPWKKRITQLQIFQFCYLSVHFLLPVLDNWCNNKFNTIYAIGTIQNIFMAFMFSDFYYKAYLKKDRNKKKIT